MTSTTFFLLDFFVQSSQKKTQTDFWLFSFIDKCFKIVVIYTWSKSVDHPMDHVTTQPLSVPTDLRLQNNTTTNQKVTWVAFSLKLPGRHRFVGFFFRRGSTCSQSSGVSTSFSKLRSLCCHRGVSADWTPLRLCPRRHKCDKIQGSKDWRATWKLAWRWSVCLFLLGTFFKRWWNIIKLILLLELEFGLWFTKC